MENCCQKRLWRAMKVFMLLLACVFGTVVAQENSIVKGTVIDGSGEPLVGVSVLVKGTTTGVVSGLDGTFSISVRNGETLVFSYVGYIKQEQLVGKEKNLKIVLQEDAKSLEEVVVVGYGTQKKVNLTGDRKSVV